MIAKPIKKGFDLSLISKYRNELYGIAILLIMLFHFTDVYIQHFDSFSSDSFKAVVISLYDRYVSSIGVELFVFLSGMSMYYSYTREPKTRSFYAKRYKRVLIPYFYAGGLFWIIKDAIILAEGIGRTVKDFLFITFFTEGVRTIWFILFLIIAYAILPFAYRAIFKKNKVSIVAFIGITIIMLGLPVLLSFTDTNLFAYVEVVLTRLPLFVTGVFLGKYIKDGIEVPRLCIAALIIAAAGLKYYDISNNTEQYVSRYIAAVCGLALLCVLVYCLKLLDTAERVRSVFRFLGKYSLELYLLHVTIRNLMETLELQSYRLSRYAMIMTASILLAPLLHKLTGWTQKHLLTGEHRSE